MRRRLDAELVRRGLVPSRERARAEVEAGNVLVAGAIATKVTHLVGADEPVVLTGPPPRFVGRGGEKLDAALERFAVDVAGRRALDAGASTGGFTDCLLQRGAREVFSVDVGHSQFHERLRADPRVHNMERTNVRTLTAEAIGGPVEVLVGDLSFISLRTVLPALLGLVVPGAPLVLLVKPQFEAGRQEVAKGRGIVRDPATWRRVLGDVVAAAAEAGAAMMGSMASPITGADGNHEFLLHLQAGGPSGAPDVVEHALDDAVAEATGGTG
jgi:23S rRNA (cytidine1920-2'-O)/16S rRNA (cytidine1409-2'-O)-methyltransferase